MTQLTRSAPFALLPPDATAVDRSLAAALEEMAQPDHRDSECNDSVRPIAIETAAWIAAALAVWLAIALFY
jgi:hypothetical protein